MNILTLLQDELVELIVTVEIALEEQPMEPDERENLEKVLEKLNNAPEWPLNKLPKELRKALLSGETKSRNWRLERNKGDD